MLPWCWIDLKVLRSAPACTYISAFKLITYIPPPTLAWSVRMLHRPLDETDQTDRLMLQRPEALLELQRPEAMGDVYMSMTVFPQELLTLIGWPNHLYPHYSSICVTQGPVSGLIRFRSWDVSFEFCQVNPEVKTVFKKAFVERERATWEMLSQKAKLPSSSILCSYTVQLFK